MLVQYTRIYGLNDDCLLNPKAGIFEQPEDQIANVGAPRKIILFGDLNCRIGLENNDIIIWR